jgi:starvation-inducible DNA-binding protein
MFSELARDNEQLVITTRATRGTCDDYNDIATASPFEGWLDEAKRRTWVLFEMTRNFPGNNR